MTGDFEAGGHGLSSWNRIGLGCWDQSFARLARHGHHDRRYDPAILVSSHRGQESHRRVWWRPAFFGRRGDAAVDGGAALGGGTPGALHSRSARPLAHPIRSPTWSGLGRLRSLAATRTPTSSTCCAAIRSSSPADGCPTDCQGSVCY